MKTAKKTVLAELPARGRGSVVVRGEELMPFLKAVDAATVKCCIDEKFKHEGAKLLTTLAGSVEKDSDLWLLFVNSVLSIVPELLRFSFKVNMMA